MMRLIRLETKKHRLAGYARWSMGICVFLLMFLWLFRHVSVVESADQDMRLLAQPERLIPMFLALGLTLFSILGAVMLSRVVTEAYSGRQVLLLFSYPSGRCPVLLAKIFAVGGVLLVSMPLACGIAAAMMAFLFPLVTGNNPGFEVSELAGMMGPLVAATFMAFAIAVIATGIGFVKRSVPMTLLSAVVMSSLLCNAVLGGAGSASVFPVAATVLVVLATGAVLYLAHHVRAMEV